MANQYTPAEVIRRNAYDLVMRRARQLPGRPDGLTRLVGYCQVPEVGEGITKANRHKPPEKTSLRVSVQGKRKVCHVLVYEHHHGAIPDDKEVSHLCATANCVNIDHLMLETHAENMRRIGCPGWVCYVDPDGHPVNPHKLFSACVHETKCCKITDVVYCYLETE